MRFPKRRANLLYNLRRKGVEVDTKLRIIYLPFDEDPYKHSQTFKLCKEFHFNIQYCIM